MTTRNANFWTLFQEKLPNEMKLKILKYVVIDPRGIEYFPLVRGEASIPFELLEYPGNVGDISRDVFYRHNNFRIELQSELFTWAIRDINPFIRRITILMSPTVYSWNWIAKLASGRLNFSGLREVTVSFNSTEVRWTGISTRSLDSLEHAMKRNRICFDVRKLVVEFNWSIASSGSYWGSVTRARFMRAIIRPVLFESITAQLRDTNKKHSRFVTERRNGKETVTTMVMQI
ncbi:hypothetical protein K458DRAFT_387155 [Lentithecium fluviatile CBS 122367]|uniref:Uncharacterized protein n=1 Tax=Lentithecium fluviatile CBS 122367 TaxID=1168545 RepID=A0A6G1J6I6_9PLEO|nr:hypothetical protein K458DRAFT_387155 [Lentithecium fluviatile CBS 122367]